MAAGVHVCRGNFKGRYLSEGGYEAVAERFFGGVNATHFLLEYNTMRAGDFAPLRFVPKDKGVVLGLISTKTSALETSDALKRRIEEASRHIDLDRLAIGPQCGFASTVAGNPLTEADQRAKLAEPSRSPPRFGAPDKKENGETLDDSGAPERTRELWLATLEKFRYDADRPANAECGRHAWTRFARRTYLDTEREAARGDTVSLREQSVLSPPFRTLGMLPSDIRSVDDLDRWPVVDKTEMMADADEHPPYGTYTTVDRRVWAKRGWMMFSSSGSTGAPRVFRYTHVDREAWAWANARALTPWGFGPARRSS